MCCTTPEHLLNVTVRPLILGPLFTCAFSGGIIIAVRANYRGYLIGRILGINMGGTTEGAGVGVAATVTPPGGLLTGCRARVLAGHQMRRIWR